MRVAQPTHERIRGAMPRLHLNRMIKNRGDPENEFEYSNRGFTYYQLGQLERSVQDLSEAIRLNSQFGNPYALRAQANTHLGNDDDAQLDISRAARLGIHRGVLEAEIVAQKNVLLKY